MERLQKVMARAGVASRRHCEKMIAAGLVKVNGRIVTEPGVKVDPVRDEIKVGNEVVFPSRRKYYLLLYKPRGYVTTLSDERGRKKVADLLKGIKERVYPVGRLDYNSEGLLLMTNDGDLAYGLTHPGRMVHKTYLVRVSGFPEPEKLEQMEKGIPLKEGVTSRARVRVVGQRQGNALLEITVHEGRNRLVRRMCDFIGHPVLRLKRIKLGNLSLDGLEPGEYRHLTVEELRVLKKKAGLEKKNKR
ncbi:MAG TPA: pseudouridine synthase [Bacillota bacterium]|nr:pseudouridine synthase [Bacillota bacterium]